MIPLVVRSHFSMMRGTASVRELVRAAKKTGYDTLALTDTDNLYGLWPFTNECKREGIRPIIGAELTDPLTADQSGSGRAVCLVENAKGYKNLCRLISARHCNESFDLERELISKGGSLIVLTDDARLLAAWHYAGLSVYAAMPRNSGGCPEFVRKVAARLKVPPVALPGSFFLRPEDYKLHRLLRAIDLNTSLSRLPDCETAPRDAWLAPPAEYARRFALYPQALAATHEIAKRCEFSGPDGSVVFPPWDGNGKSVRGGGASAALREDAYKGAKRRYGAPLPEAVTERLEHELKSIEGKKFSSYFLVVRDIVVKSPRICGRGSGAASLVAYCLGITNVCPIKHNLYFERFLNPGRKDPPDIDVDFAWDERDEVIDSVLEKFKGHAAMVCNHVTFKPRMAIRETAKVFGIPEGEINRVTKRLPWSLSSYRPDGLLASVKGRPEMRGLRFDDPWPEIFGLAQRIIGAPRHVSVHCGGVVITPNPINEYAPLERAPKGVPIIQWEKEGTEQSGLVKIDLLGNRSLGVIRDAVNNVRGNGEEFDDFHWEPEDDPATRQSVAKGRTMGCFYIESPAMRLLQERARRGDFEHLVIHSSIIRPAANDYIREYLRRLHGGSWEPLHPLLKEVLNETYGIMVYQEDVSRVAVALAGFSHEGADILRKILSKKDRERGLAVLRESFFKGAAQKSVSEEKISEIWNMIMSFDGYSFCKPHSASYAKVSFQAAYMKTHYPAEFMAAVISNQGGFYSAFAYVSEARRMGCRVLPPDVNESDIRWKGRGREIRVGLMSVNGLSGETQERIAGECSSARFKSFGDFLERVRLHEDEARSLVHAGACGSVAGDQSHAKLLWKLHSHKQSTTTEGAKDAKGRNCLIKRVPLSCESQLPRADRQTTAYEKAFSFSASLASFAVTPPVLPPDDETELLRREFSALGFLCGIHPITLFKNAIERHGVVKVKDLRRYVGKRVRVAGWLITGKVVSTKKGEPMEFLTFEDETGLVETTFFPRAYARFCHMLNREQPYILEGLLEEDFGAITLTVDDVKKVTMESGKAEEITQNKSYHLLSSYRRNMESMCGRFVLIATVEDLVEKFRIAEAQKVEGRYNIAPGQNVAAVRQAEVERKLDSLRWGLVPSWSKDPKIGYRMINARAETVGEKPAYRVPFKKRRCIVPASGFYEWAKSGKEKRPHYIKFRDNEPFGIAALWDAWEGEGGVIESCTLITTSANKLISAFHDRMPVILPSENYDEWLDPAFNDKEKIKKLLRPHPDKEMEAFEVSKEVNSPKNENPELIKPLTTENTEEIEKKREGN